MARPRRCAGPPGHSDALVNQPDAPPRVSVILPTFNRAEYLARSVGSVLSQTFADFELLVVDDGSTDTSAEVVAGFGDPRIRYVRLRVNHGQAVARNVGIRDAQGQLVAFQDSDDEWVQDKLALQVGVMDARPRVAVVYGDLLRVPAAGEAFVLPAPELRRFTLFDERPTRYATYGLGIQSCLFRRRVLLRLGGFEEQMRCFEDLELLLRLTRWYRSLKLRQVLVRYFETDGVSVVQANEHTARLFLLRRYRLAIRLRCPAWRAQELESIRRGLPLGAPMQVIPTR